MLLAKQEQVEKDIIALEKRKSELSKLKYSREHRQYKQLDKPFQDGWWLNIVLRDDASRRDDADRMQRAIDACSNRFHEKDPKIISKVRQLRSLEACRGLFYNKLYFYTSYFHGPGINKLNAKQYEALPEDIRSYYYKSEEIQRWGNVAVKCYHLNYGKIPHYYLVLKATPRMVTHLYEPDPQVESEYKWVSDKLDQMMAWASSNLRKWERKYDSRRIRMAVRAGKRKFLSGEKEEILVQKRDLKSG